MLAALLRVSPPRKSSPPGPGRMQTHAAVTVVDADPARDVLPDAGAIPSAFWLSH